MNYFTHIFCNHPVTDLRFLTQHLQGADQDSEEFRFQIPFQVIVCFPFLNQMKNIRIIDILVNGGFAEALFLFQINK